MPKYQIQSQIRSAGLGANVAGANTDWLTPNNIIASNDTYATASLVLGGFSDILRASTFGFTIPVKACIKGIIVRIERSKTDISGGEIRDVSVQLYNPKTNAFAGDNNAYTTENWPDTTDAKRWYGGNTDLWGLTLTPGNINDAEFGVGIAVTDSTPGALARIDNIEIEVFYQYEGACDVDDLCALIETIKTFLANLMNKIRGYEKIGKCTNTLYKEARYLSGVIRSLERVQTYSCAEVAKIINCVSKITGAKNLLISTSN